jgi:hypothetical protein
VTSVPLARGTSVLALLALGLMASLTLSLGAAVGPAGAVSTDAPPVNINPAAAGGKFADGQVVRVSVGANSHFVPHSHVAILECADPGGNTAGLPTSLAGCDENTIQGDTTVVEADGSFVEPNYTLYALPSAVLGEQANWQPICNATTECVLFVGEDQNDFTQPKAFSTPFLMTGGGAVAAPSPSPTAASAPPTAPVSASVSLPATELAFTGVPGELVALAGGGVVLILLATVGTLVVRRSGR